MSDLPAHHAKPIRLASVIVKDTIDGQYDAANRHLQRLHTECGWNGIWQAVRAACDTIHDHATGGDMNPVRIRPAAMAVETGAITAQPPARIAWAHRLIAARVAMDEQAYRAVQEEILTLDESGPYIAAVFESVALTIRSMPRGYALMGAPNA